MLQLEDPQTEMQIDDTHAKIYEDDTRAVMPTEDPDAVIQEDDQRTEMLNELQHIDNIAERLDDDLLPEKVKEMAKLLFDHTNKMRKLINLHFNSRQGEHDQATMAVQDKETMKERVPEKTSVCILTSLNESKKRIQILNPVQTEATSKFSLALKNKMSDVECTLLSQNDPLDQRMPLIVVCQSASRLKPDVDLALATVRWPLEYVVILFHNGVKDNLPAVPTANKLQSYSNVIFVDMGFSYHGDILNCDQNTMAEVQLHSYITDFYKRVQ